MPYLGFGDPTMGLYVCRCCMLVFKEKQCFKLKEFDIFVIDKIDFEVMYVIYVWVFLL